MAKGELSTPQPKNCCKSREILDRKETGESLKAKVLDKKRHGLKETMYNLYMIGFVQILHLFLHI